MRSEQPLESTCDIDEVKKHLLYYKSVGEEENIAVQCAVAISPTTAVTYYHGRNGALTPRCYERSKVTEPGSILKLYTLFGTKKEVVNGFSVSYIFLVKIQSKAKLRAIF
jgi:hypothetical protein